MSNDFVQQRNRLKGRISSTLAEGSLLHKWNSGLVGVFIFGLALLLGYLMARSAMLGFSLIGLTCGAAVVLICLANTEAGLYINMIFSFFAFHLSRLLFNDTLQVGVISDVLIVATLFSFFIRGVSLRQSVNEFVQTRVLVFLLLVYCFTALQLFNPNAQSINGWFQAFRKVLGTLLLLFISFNVFASPERIRRFIIVLFLLCSFAGLYGCIQQWLGLFDFEMAWIMADSHRFGLMYIAGDFRKFSTFSDPTAYSIVMGAASIFFLVLFTGQKKMLVRVVLLTGVIFMLLGMGYSGTRTANAMVVAGIAMFILLTINRRGTQVFAFFAGLCFLVLMYGPFYNPTVSRFRTTFSASQDASFNVRENNRKMIQPYLHRHPIGGGLGTTGESGATFHPGHYLAGFQPDSGYLKKALELGWIGLILFCLLNFMILKTGIRGYFSGSNGQIKLLFAACTSAIFAFYVADFAQVAIGQITDIVLYYPFVALILRLHIIDKTLIKETGS